MKVLRHCPHLLPPSLWIPLTWWDPLRFHLKGPSRQQTELVEVEEYAGHHKTHYEEHFNKMSMKGKTIKKVKSIWKNPNQIHMQTY